MASGVLVADARTDQVQTEQSSTESQSQTINRNINLRSTRELSSLVDQLRSENSSIDSISLSGVIPQDVALYTDLPDDFLDSSDAFENPTFALSRLVEISEAIQPNTSDGDFPTINIVYSLGRSQEQQETNESMGDLLMMNFHPLVYK